MVEQELKNAIEKMKKDSPARKFVESVDIAINLKDINLQDPSKRFQMDVRLPHPLEKEIKICVLGEGSHLVEAESAGAARIINKDELDNISRDPKSAKKLAKQFDFFIATASLMPTIGRSLGKFLGPRGRMPRPLPPGTPIEPLIKNLQSTIQVRLRQAPVIHNRIGTIDMENDSIVENALTVIRNVESRLEKGEHNIRTIYIKTTMGPPISIK